MSTQEMEQMDQEVMAVVNNHARAEAEKAAEEILQEQQEKQVIPELAAEGAMEDPEAAARRKLHEEELAELEKKWRRKKNWRTVLCVALCVLIAAALLATLAKPELLILLVSLGVISCSVVAGIAIDRWARRKGW